MRSVAIIIHNVGINEPNIHSRVRETNGRLHTYGQADGWGALCRSYTLIPTAWARMATKASMCIYICV